MMFKKTVLCAVTALFTTPLFANIPIESRGLSQTANQASMNTQSASSAGVSTSVQTNTSWQIMQKNQQLESDLRILRGKMEEQENEIAQLKSELTNRYADLDQRLELLQQKIEPAEENPTEDNPQDSSPSLNANEINTASSGQQPTELDKAAYTVALDAYKNGGAAKAIAPMQNFIKNNPNSVYISNAYFWLAEFNLAIDPPNFEEAKRNYTIVADRYPKSTRASRALYQLHNISKDVEQKPAIATQYKNKLLSNYPQSEEAKFFK